MGFISHQGHLEHKTFEVTVLRKEFPHHTRSRYYSTPTPSSRFRVDTVSSRIKKLSPSSDCAHTIQFSKRASFWCPRKPILIQIGL